MSMLKICGQELELDLFDADTMEVYEKSMDEVVKRAEESKKHTELSNADDIREMCGIVKTERLKSCSRVKTTWQSAWMLSELFLLRLVR